MNMMSPDINLSKEAPQEEPLRQYYYIEKAKQYVEEEAKNLGRSLTFCVTTFGCQMNARDSEKLRGILDRLRRSRRGRGGFCDLQYVYSS